MGATATFDNARLSEAMSTLSKLSGRSFKTVVQSEATKVLEKASSLTVKADVKKIQASIQKTNDPKKRRMLTYRLAAIGLAKRAFYELAQKMALPNLPKVPAYVIKAQSPKMLSSDTDAKESGFGASYIITGVIDGSRTYPGAAMFSAINKAMRGRANYFKTLMKKGALDHLESLLRQYPFLKVIK
jgi:hypothetical protein